MEMLISSVNLVHKGLLYECIENVEEERRFKSWFFYVLLMAFLVIAFCAICAHNMWSILSTHTTAACSNDAELLYMESNRMWLIFKKVFSYSELIVHPNPP